MHSVSATMLGKILISMEHIAAYLVCNQKFTFVFIFKQYPQGIQGKFYILVLALSQ